MEKGLLTDAIQEEKLWSMFRSISWRFDEVVRDVMQDEDKDLDGKKALIKEAITELGTVYTGILDKIADASVKEDSANVETTKSVTKGGAEEEMDLTPENKTEIAEAVVDLMEERVGQETPDDDKEKGAKVEVPKELTEALDAIKADIADLKTKVEAKSTEKADDADDKDDDKDKDKGDDKGEEDADKGEEKSDAQKQLDELGEKLEAVSKLVGKKVITSTKRAVMVEGEDQPEDEEGFDPETLEGDARKKYFSAKMALHIGESQGNADMINKSVAEIERIEKSAK